MNNNLTAINEKNNLATTAAVPVEIDAAYTRTLTKESMRTYVQCIKDFFFVDNIREVTVQQIQSVTPDVANAWANEMLVNGLTKATINKKLSAMKNFYDFLCRRYVHLAEYNPFATKEGCIRYKNAIKPYSDKRALEPDEVKRLLESVDVESHKGTKEYITAVRDSLVLQLLVSTGMRREEIAGITIGDLAVNYGHHVINIIGKGDKHRVVVVTEPIWNNIKKYMRLRNITLEDKDQYLITSHSNATKTGDKVNGNTIWRIVKKAASAAGIGADDIAPHNLRHTYCTQSIELGASLEDVALTMGHSDTKTTRRYEHSSRAVRRSTADALTDLFEIHAV